MEFNFILPENFKKQSVKHLLEDTWLIPRKLRYFLRIKKHFLINNQVANEELFVKAGDNVHLIFDVEDFPELTVPFGDAQKADILYEDDFFVVANKPCGMKTHGNLENELALQNHVAAALNQPVYVVHRLDEATSGAVLFAKNQFVLPILGQLFEQNKIHREYLALVYGTFAQNHFTINQPIGKDRHDKRKQVISKTGKAAITHVTVLENLKQKSLLKLILDTGRTHQIRVHLSAMNKPIVGDTLYTKDNNEARLMLHAAKLIFPNPFSGENIEVLAPSQSFDDRYQQEKSNKNESNR
ncbi:RluA family pseudouridine synthase [Lactococcus nasutitermitis]|uniref:Pseudouridine synthase n=1 Tax=Lactococcus nasutitermitis TaxID=1652957 RepID=A0ABV9JDS9_9LACT|nr:RluA family pseudouridine synthase [Lactococcus nasutitermitis]